MCASLDLQPTADRVLQELDPPEATDACRSFHCPPGYWECSTAPTLSRSWGSRHFPASRNVHHVLEEWGAGASSDFIPVKVVRVPRPGRSHYVVQPGLRLPAENLTRSADVGEEGDRVTGPA